MLLHIATLALALLGSAQDADEPRFSPEAVHGDLDALRACLLAMHPSLDRFMSMDEARAHLDAAVEQPLGEWTETELLAEVGRVLALFGCSHTSCSASDASSRRARASSTLLPVNIGMAEGRVFVTQDLSIEGELGRGAELVAIDGLTCAERIAFTAARIGADGFGRARQRRAIERLFFWRNRWTLGPRDSFRFRVRRNGEERTVTVAGVDYATRKRMQKQRYPDDVAGDTAAVSLDIDDEHGIALLRVASFYEDGGDGAWFAERFEKAFAAIRAADVADLIIDVRDNGGGWDESPADLFACFAREPFPTYRRLLRVVENAPTGVALDLDADDFSEYAPAPADALARIDEPGGLGALVDHYIDTHPMLRATWYPADEPYAGRVWILINGGSGSSGAEFPSYVKYYRRGTLIGEETGGGYAGCTAGILPTVSLPNSGIRVRIPLIRYELAYELTPDDASRGVRPDVRVEPTVEDVLAGRDAVMEVALERIRAARQVAPQQVDEARAK